MSSTILLKISKISDSMKEKEHDTHMIVKKNIIDSPLSSFTHIFYPIFSTSQVCLKKEAISL